MKKQHFNQNVFPAICTPITGKSINEIITEVKHIITKKPDLLEWRVDFFEDINNTEKVIAALKEIHLHSEGIPLLFTIRSLKEGGQEISLDESEVVTLLTAVCQNDYVDMIDFELNSERVNVERIVEIAKRNEKKLVLSYHNFKYTPSKEELLDYMKEMESVGADVAKIAVMPQQKVDVFTLLDVTKEADQLLNIPIVTISMSDLGMITRVMGWYYGSCLTFAVGGKSSAPGQIPINTLRQKIETLKDLEIE